MTKDLRKKLKTKVRRQTLEEVLQFAKADDSGFMDEYLRPKYISFVKENPKLSNITFDTFKETYVMRTTQDKEMLISVKAYLLGKYEVEVEIKKLLSKLDS